MTIRQLLLGSVLAMAFGAPLRAATGPAMPGGELVAASGVFDVLNGDRQWLASIEYRLAPQQWGLRPWLGVAASEGTTWFASAGLLYTVQADGWRCSLGFAPSYYTTAVGKQLGQDLEFYTYAEVGYLFPDGQAINVRFGHISNAHLADKNPGAEILELGFSIPLPW